jgi:signal transduction histidine kinase
MSVSLSIRARLAVGYGLAMAAALTVVALVVGAVHERLGMARVDTELANAMRSASGVVNSEINERRELRAGAREAMFELELPGVGVSVLDTEGRVLATRRAGAPEFDHARLGAIEAGQQAITLEPAAASHWEHQVVGGYTVVAWTALLPLDRDHTTVMNTLRIAIPIGALAALGAGWLMVSRALRPLSRMAAEADVIDPRHLDAQLPVPAPADELRRLAVAFNGVLDRLSRSASAQRRFMADASHELRTPISVTRTAAQVTLSAPHRSEDEYREAAGIVAGQAERMTRIVDDLFLLAVADDQGRKLSSRYLYFDELVAESVKAAGVLAAERGITLTLTAPDSVQIRGDDELLRRMAMNLLDNAIRYSRAGGTVSVTVAPGPDACVRLVVEDQGPAVPEEQRQRIFERFVRLETARPTSGGGLGLPIARWIAEQHGGSLQLESSGQGNRFVATLRVGS